MWHLREGLGTVTNNVAKYRGLILGMVFALCKGFRVIEASGDSLAVCNQIKGEWEIRNPTLISLNEEVQQLKLRFSHFWILHVGRILDQRYQMLMRISKQTKLPIFQARS